jgi:hypothetical protein
MTAVGDALKPIEAVALDNDLRAILECMIAGIHVDGRRSAANRVAVVVLAAWTGTNSRAYWNFESSSLQQTVCLSPDFSSDPGKARFFRHSCGRAGRQCRKRRAKSSNIAARTGSVSAGRYSSTAVLPDAVCEIGGGCK